MLTLFDYFSIGVPDKDAIDQLAARLTEPDPGTVTVINDPRESAERHERAAARQP